MGTNIRSSSLFAALLAPDDVSLSLKLHYGPIVHIQSDQFAASVGAGSMRSCMNRRGWATVGGSLIGPVLLASAVAVLLAGCALVLPGGPLVLGGDPTAGCMPAAVHDQIVIGDFVGAPAQQDIRIDEVTLVEPEGLTLNDAYLLPMVEGELLGAWTFPPETSTWGDREEADGAVIPAGERRNILLVMERTGEADGTAETIQVEYTAGSQQFTKSGTQSFEVAEACF